MLVLEKKQIAEMIEKIADDIANSLGETEEIAVVGIRSKGIFIAKRLAALLSSKLQKEVDCGSIDITLYRDDVHDPAKVLSIAPTDIQFDVEGKTIILVDDVLHTGRSCRAAMDSVIEFGRPSAIRLATLIERDRREFPIQADFVGMHIKAGENQKIAVSSQEADGIDEVRIVEIGNR
jgi:pyrimidine operon attenuation protein / uracil phosphoribosyltransferase